MKPLTPTTPHVIILVGIPGSGKTHFGEYFAKTFHAPYINQEALQNLSGVHDDIATALSGHILDELLKTQRTLVYEAPLQTRVERLSLYKKLSKAGYKPLLVWVQTDTAEAKRRSQRAGRDIDFEAHVKRFQQPTSIEKPIVISGKHTHTTQVRSVLKHLAGTRPDDAAKPPHRPPAGRNIVIR